METSQIANSIVTLILFDVAFAMITGGLGIHGAFVDWGVNIGADLGIEPWFEHAHSHAAHGATDVFNMEATGISGHEGHVHSATESFNHGSHASDAGYSIDHSTHNHSHATAATDAGIAPSEAGGSAPTEAGAHTDHSHDTPACYDAEKNLITIDENFMYQPEKEVFIKDGRPFAGPRFHDMLMNEATQHPGFSSILDTVTANPPQTLSADLMCPAPGQ